MRPATGGGVDGYVDFRAVRAAEQIASGAVTYRPAKAWRIFGWTFSVSMALFGVLGAIGGFHGGDVGGGVVCLLFGAGASVAFARGAASYVTCTSEALRSRNLFRTLQLDRRDVVDVRVGNVRQAQAPTLTLVVARRNGRSIPLAALASYDTVRNRELLENRASVLRNVLGASGPPTT